MWWSSSSTSSSRSLRKERREGGIVSCMSGMLQLFDFHLRGAIDCTGSSASQVPAPSQSEDLALCCTAGIEAPRNSLEVLPAANSGLLPQLRNRQHQRGHGDEIDDIPMAFEIFARSESGRDWTLTYPDTRRKSRSVVARLMGLDILPDAVENGAGVRRGGGEGRRKNFSFVKPLNIDCSRGNGDGKAQRPKETTKLKERNRDLRVVATTVRQEPLPSCSRSLPESPRISSARRSDVEHRLSLQIQKENIPPLVNVNFVDGCPLGALLRASSSSAMNSDTRKMSPRLVLSSNSPRVGKTREEKGQQRPSGTPPCSPRLKYRGDPESTTTVAAAAAAAAAAATTVPKPSLPRKKRTYPTQSTDPSSKANGPGSRLHNSINGKPKSEGSSLLREGSDAMGRIQKKDRVPSPRIRESYVKVLDRSNGDAMKKGQRPISEHALLKAHFVISASKDSPRQLRTSSASGISPLPRSRRKTAAATSDIRQDAGSVVADHLCNHLLQHHHHDKHQCMDPPPSSSLPNPRTIDSPSSSTSSSLSSFLSSSASTSTTSSSASSSSSCIKEKDEAFLLIYPYIKTMLELMGVSSNSRVSLLKWHSPSHPIDPAIFTQLDAFHRRGHDDDGGGAMEGRMPNTRSNRKLIFHLVDELLGERLKLQKGLAPGMTMTMKSPASWSPAMKVATGKQLLEAVWAEVRGFPSADCKIVHDVDVLVANDVLAGHHSSPINDSTTEAFAEAVLFRVGQDISDELVAEAVADFLPAPHRSNSQDSCPGRQNMIR